MLEEQIKIQVSKLSPKENDIIFIKCSQPISDDDMQNIADNLRGAFRCKALFYTDGLDFSILTNERLKELGLKRI